MVVHQNYLGVYKFNSCQPQNVFLLCFVLRSPDDFSVHLAETMA